METPSSTTKRVTRSQALAALNGNTAAANNNNSNIPISRKIEDSEKGVSKSRRRSAKQQQDRSALIDITNDSPIVGLAMGNLETPSSGIAKQRSGMAKSTNTPGSGEALLRGQVKTLLQKVEEEAELSKLSLQNPFLRLQGFTNSPMGILAPTPANTPQVPNLSEDILASVTPSPILEEQIKISEVVVVVNDPFDGKSLESQKSLTRSLMLDFTEKSEISDVSSECSSVLTSKENSPATDDDNASLWSLQVNASGRDEDDDDEEEEEEEEGDDRWLVDELCEGISNMCVDENRMRKHTRYIYNSDDEIVDEDEEVDDSLSPNVVRLKGFPTPKGKHLRFQTEE